jgi:DNA anti-recombination protein RmuC
LKGFLIEFYQEKQTGLFMDSEARFEKWSEQFEARLDKQFLTLEQRINARIELSERFQEDKLSALKSEINHRFDEVGRRFEDVNRRFEKTENILETVRANVTHTQLRASLAGATAGFAVSIASFAVFWISRFGFAGVK